MPDLAEDDDTTRLGIGITEGKNDEEGSFGIWEDEESKLFYEDIIDLKNCVPASLLCEKKEEEEKEVHLDTILHFNYDGEDDINEDDYQDDEKEKEIYTGQSEIDLLLQRLITSHNTIMLDKIIIDYMYEYIVLTF